MNRLYGRVLSLLVLLTIVLCWPAHAQTGSAKTPAQLNDEIRRLFPNNVGIIAPFPFRTWALDMVASTAGAPALNVKGFGAKGDGVTDDTTAIAAWLAALQNAPSPAVGYLPPGNYIFNSELSIGSGGKGDIAIIGAGPYQTVLTYAGASTTTDMLTIGDGVSETHHWYLSGFKITSNTTMTAGSALHTKLMGRSFMDHVIMDGQDGTGKLWNGFWFDAIDTTTLSGFEARGQNDGLRVNGKGAGVGPNSDLYLRSGKIALSAVGLHIGGAMGGVTVDDTDIIANDINAVVDQTIVASANLQIFFGKGVAFDTPRVGPNFQLSDAGEFSSRLFFTGTWMASSPNNSLNIGPGSTFRIAYTGGTVTNNGHDGVYDGSGGTVDMNFTGVRIEDNGGSGIGWGFNASGPVTASINDCTFRNNTSGNIHPLFNAPAAGGSTPFLPFGNGLGIYFGSGPPTISAALGSLYMRTDGSSTTTRLYINIDGSTGWTNVVTSS